MVSSQTRVLVGHRLSKFYGVEATKASIGTSRHAKHKKTRINSMIIQ